MMFIDTTSGIDVHLVQGWQKFNVEKKHYFQVNMREKGYA